MKILISACLLGQNVKYNGGNNDITENRFMQKLLQKDILVPFCPEVEGGLPIPRVPVEVFNGRAINRNGEDKTYNFNLGAQKALEICIKYNVKYAILKSRSPSCGIDGVYDGTFTRNIIDGMGVCAKLLSKNGIELFSEKNIEKLEKLIR